MVVYECACQLSNIDSLMEDQWADTLKKKIIRLDASIFHLTNVCYIFESVWILNTAFFL